MPTSKPQDIVDAVYALVNTALSATYTVQKGRRVFEDAELPAVCVYRTTFSWDDRARPTTRMDGNIIIEGFALAKPAATDIDDYDPATVAEGVLYAIQAAVEGGTDRFLGNKVVDNGIALYSTSIEYPDHPEGNITVRAEYAAPHVHHHGTP